MHNCLLSRHRLIHVWRPILRVNRIRERMPPRHTESDQPRGTAPPDKPDDLSREAPDTPLTAPFGSTDPDHLGRSLASADGLRATRLSCVHCRRKKMKCDRVYPQCARCNRFKRECVYPESKQSNSGRRRLVKGSLATPGSFETPSSPVGRT